MARSFKSKFNASINDHIFKLRYAIENNACVRACTNGCMCVCRCNWYLAFIYIYIIIIDIICVCKSMYNLCTQLSIIIHLLYVACPLLILLWLQSCIDKSDNTTEHLIIFILFVFDSMWIQWMFFNQWRALCVWYLITHESIQIYEADSFLLN